ncbi:hypothetical protein IQ231_20960 [Cuspidothrix issatschenkoi LEGE 03284]|uniref:hypothetical protein n=1 Tax=Cuspidothrix issatschenkoi TaxID=230752 RepID=UPI0018811BA2|nr:hypothetical protein [Cuspidothrix issatschenkoi]MBE9234066.1 hypothetical protein [Cuspidothrix issatschenkoi LEGE 03284]
MLLFEVRNVGYKIYRYVQSKKEAQQATREYISHATELLSYGIYKYLGLAEKVFS